VKISTEEGVKVSTSKSKDLPCQEKDSRNSYYGGGQGDEVKLGRTGEVEEEGERAKRKLSVPVFRGSNGCDAIRRNRK